MNVTGVRPGEVAVMEYVVGIGSVVNVITALPDGPVVVDVGVIVPPVEVHDTGTFGTAFPNWSVDRTINDVDADATTVCESVLTRTSFVGGAARAVAVALAFTPVAESVMVLMPDVVPSVHDTVACPLASDVTLVGATVPLPTAGVIVTASFGTPTVAVEFMTRKPIVIVAPTTADCPWLMLSMTSVFPVRLPPGVVGLDESFPQAARMASAPANSK